MAAKIDVNIKDAIRMKYIQTNIDQRSLANEFGVCLQTINRWSRAENWIKMREDYQRELAEKAIIVAQEQRLKHVEDINKTDAEIWKLFKEKVRMLVLVNNKPVELSHLAQIMERAQKGARLALGLDKIALNEEEMAQAAKQFKELVKMDVNEVAALFENDGDLNDSNNE